MQIINDWYCNYKGKLLAIACQKGYCYEEAKDIVQQFFLELLQKELGEVRHPESYLLRAFKNKLIDLHRLNRNAPAVHENSYFVPSTLEMIEELESNKEMVAKIFEAYKKVPARYRRTIYLKFYRGLTTEQIIEETGFSQQTIYNNISKGIKLIKLHLENKTPLSRLAGVFLSFLP